MPFASASTAVYTATQTHSAPRRASTALKRDELLTLIRESDALLQIEPTCLHTRAVRGHAYMKAKLWDRAVADFTAILEARPDDIHARFSRGMAMFKGGRVDDAHADFSCVLELNPHHVMARYARAGCYNSEGQFHHAIEEYTIALQHDEMENELLSGVRNGKSSHSWHYDRGRMGVPGDNEVDHIRQQQRAHERRATPNAAAWSPPRRQDQADARRESAPALALSQQARDTTPPTTQQPHSTTTTKRPRKVVQVKLNLSEFIATSSAPQAPTVTHSRRGSDPRVSVPASAPPVISHTAATESTHLATASNPSHPPIQAPHSSEGRETAASDASALPLSHAPRRAVRRVTIAL